jgi:uncharacterized protein YdeI (YjbR/CyaY-like superfamily)
MSTTNPKVDEYFRKGNKWQEEFEHLRRISLDCGLNEELKWRLPCYTFEGSNVVILQDFKEYCALMFFKGALLKDPEGVLHNVGDAQAVRQLRFTGVEEVVKAEPTIRSYIREAIEVEQAGLKVELEEKDEPVPEELESKFDEDPAFKAAFEALTPGRRRGYIHYFRQAKQSKTRASRIEKYAQHILDGKGLNDQ